MDYLLIFWGSFLLAISGALMPGPVLTATISEVTRRGFWAGPRIIVGHAVVEGILLVGLVRGAGPWLEQESVVGWLGVVGGIALVGMGTAMWRGASSAGEVLFADPAVTPDPGRLRGPVASGVVTTLSNPYWYGWWATVGFSLAAQSLAHGRAGITVFFAGHLGADFGWYGLVAAAVAGGRRFIGPSGYRVVIRGCGTLLVAIGGIFVALGLPRV